MMRTNRLARPARVFVPAMALVPALALVLSLGACGSRPRAVADNPGERISKAQTTAVQARQALDKGDYTRAISLSEESLGYSQDLFATWNNLGLAYMKTGQRLQAAEAFRRASDLAPTESAPDENLALLWLDAGYANDALEHAKRALSRSPNSMKGLRLGIQAADRARAADESIREWAKRAIMLEKEPVWLKYFEEQRFRIDAQIDAENRGYSRRHTESKPAPRPAPDVQTPSQMPPAAPTTSPGTAPGTAPAPGR
jgi:Tfp pilus assembly protein PilF